MSKLPITSQSTTPPPSKTPKKIVLTVAGILALMAAVAYALGYPSQIMDIYIKWRELHGVNRPSPGSTIADVNWEMSAFLSENPKVLLLTNEGIMSAFSYVTNERQKIDFSGTNWCLVAPVGPSVSNAVLNLSLKNISTGVLNSAICRLTVSTELSPKADSRWIKVDDPSTNVSWYQYALSAPLRSGEPEPLPPVTFAAGQPKNSEVFVSISAKGTNEVGNSWKFLITFPALPKEIGDLVQMPQIVKAFRNPKNGKLVFGFEARVPTSRVDEIKSRFRQPP